MTTLILTTTVMAGLMFIMAVGVIFSGKCLQGSCGGGSTPEDCACETARLEKNK
jgi:hypothetical protein